MSVFGPPCPDSLFGLVVLGFHEESGLQTNPNRAKPPSTLWLGRWFGPIQATNPSGNLMYVGG